VPAPEISEHEIKFRQAPAKGFSGFHRKKDGGGPGISYVFGIHESGTSQIQSIVFEKNKFSVSAARAWIKSHNFKTAEGSLPQTASFDQPLSLKEAELDDEKHEIVLTLLQEGPGNLRDNRYYTRSCIETAGPVFMSRRKLFFNHLMEGRDFGSTDIKDWAATLKETFTVEGEGGMLHRKGRLKIHEEWLWKRCKEAPEEIAVSIEGQGAGHADVINGKNYHAIEKIVQLNGTKFVPYPGNATMGADLVESEIQKEEEMKIEDLTLKQLQEARPELIEEISKSVTEQAKKDVEEAKKAAATAAAAKEGDVKAIAEQLEAKFAKQIEGMKSATSATIEGLQKKVVEAEKRADASDIRDRIRAKKDLVNRLVAESDLPTEAKSDHLRERCYVMTEKKGQDKDGKEVTISVEEQVKSEIAEQKRLVTGDFGHVRDSGKESGQDENLTEAEEQHLREAWFMGSSKSDFPAILKEFRASKKEDEKKA